jgi:hypothetical protein
MLQNYTELYFVFLISASIFFFLKNKNIYLILSGLCLGASIAVRPLGWALVLGFILVQIISSVKHKKIIYRYFFVYSGAFTFIIVFGVFTLLHFGKFEFTSTTGSVNLIIGANDDATGAFNATVHQKGKIGYIENPETMTFIQKGEFYQQRAVNWIAENPLKWIVLAPMKFLNTYGWDDISLSYLLGYKDTNFAREIKFLVFGGDQNQGLKLISGSNKLIYFFILFFLHVYYYLLLLFILFGILRYIKEKYSNDAINIILLFSLIATLMIMVTVGTPRYKYPMFILLLPFASAYLIAKFKIGENNIAEK